MNLHVYNEFDDLLVRDIYRLSVLMEDSGQSRIDVFATIIHLLEQRLGSFFTAEVRGRKIAFGVFAFSSTHESLKRLMYFAVKKQYRSKGFGCRALSAALELEVPTSGCVLSCSTELQTFYEKVGFTYAQIATTGDNEIVLTRGGRECGSQKTIVAAEYHTVYVDKVLAKDWLKDFEAQFRIKLFS